MRESSKVSNENYHILFPKGSPKEYKIHAEPGETKLIIGRFMECDRK